MLVKIGAVRGVDSGEGPKELCIRWGLDPPSGRDCFGENTSAPVDILNDIRREQHVAMRPLAASTVALCGVSTQVE